MNRFRAALGVCLLVAAGGLGGIGVAGLFAAQPEKNTEAGAPPEMDAAMQEMVKKMEAAAKPGVQHALLERMVGEWDAKVSMFMPGSEEPMVSAGTMKMTMVHGKRYLQMEYSAEFDGQPFTGSGMWGYNNVNGKWEGTWTDSASTGIQCSTGEFQGRKGEWEMKSEFDHWMGYRAVQREVIRMNGENEIVNRVFCTDDKGVEQKAMEIVYTRKGTQGAK